MHHVVTCKHVGASGPLRIFFGGRGGKVSCSPSWNADVAPFRSEKLAALVLSWKVRVSFNMQPVEAMQT